MNLKEAIEITGGLSETSKMPCKSYSLPPDECHVGNKLRNIRKSVCSVGYCRRGNYVRFRKVFIKKAYERLRSLKHPQWIEAMIVLISHYSKEFFRWHDVGDIVSKEHFMKIIKIAERMKTKFWVPTKEYSLARWYHKNHNHDNLIIRVSSPIIGQGPLDFPHTSTVDSGEGFICPAPLHGDQCLTCRACWDKSIKNIDYKLKWG